MDWICWVFLGAAAIHVVEEYRCPGGFLGMMKGFNPRYARFITVRFAIIFNALLLLLCLAGAIVGDRNLVFGLSVANLLLLNALIHVLSTIRRKEYTPGTVSGVLLYAPVSLYALYLFASLGGLSLTEMIVSFILGVLYQVVPIAALSLSGRLSSATSKLPMG